MGTGGEILFGYRRNQSSCPDNLESMTIQMPTGTTSLGGDYQKKESRFYN